MKSEVEIVKAFGRFAESGYKRTLFTKPLYSELTHCFGFIAHFDCDGFYEARFGTPAARVETFAVMVEEDGTNRPLNALEQRLRAMVIARGLLVAAAKDLEDETERLERAELARLKAKYEPAGTEGTGGSGGVGGGGALSILLEGRRTVT